MFFFLGGINKTRGLFQRISESATSHLLQQKQLQLHKTKPIISFKIKIIILPAIKMQMMR